MRTIEQEQQLTQRLHQQYQLSVEGELAVAEKRLLIAEAVMNPQGHFISIDRPCPLTDNLEQSLAESDAKQANAEGLPGYIALDAACFYKPRTFDKDWHGLDESDPEAAIRNMTALTERHASLTAEVGSIEQLQRYGHLLVAIWTGGRNVDNDALIEALAKQAPGIVIFVKNGLDGDIEPALRQVDRINTIRAEEGGAPAALLYRGGENAQTPEASQEQYKRAHDATNGVLIYDTAHGTEMAYHPQGIFKKSVAGQMLSSQALIHLFEQGYASLGKLSEASDIPAIMDPHMPLSDGLHDSRRLHAIKLGDRVALATQIK